MNKRDEMAQGFGVSEDARKKIENECSFPIRLIALICAVIGLLEILGIKYSRGAALRSFFWPYFKNYPDLFSGLSALLSVMFVIGGFVIINIYLNKREKKFIKDLTPEEWELYVYGEFKCGTNLPHNHTSSLPKRHCYICQQTPWKFQPWE